MRVDPPEPVNIPDGQPNEQLVSSEAPVEDPASEIFDAELLQVLGSVEPESEEFGDDLHSEIATRFQKILVNGLTKEAKEELNKKYLFPKNVPYSKAPTLNPEIEAMLVETCRLRDKRLLNKQNQIGRALSALGRAMTGLLKKKPEIPEILRALHDAGNLVADCHYAETDTRRTVIIPLVDKSLTDSFKNRKRDSFLFGESLGEVVKNSRGIKKTSQFIQATTPTTSTGLNYKGPSTRPRQQWVGQPYTHQRVGGQRTTYSNRGRRAAATNPPSQPARRQPPPPPARRQAQHRQHAASDRRRK